MSGATLQAPGGDLAVPATAKPKRLRPSRTVLAGTAALLAVAAGAAWIALPATSASTDNAYLHADSTTVAPKVRGLISAILVQDNQSVHAGDPLVRIDPEEFDARFAAATADLASARAARDSADAALASLDAEERLADAGIREAETMIRSADAQSERAAADNARYAGLVGSGAVTRSEAASFRASSITARSEADHSRATLAVSRERAAVTRARRPGLIAARAQADATILRAQAALDLARQDQGHTLIRAPIDGVVGSRSAQSGDYVQPGTRLLTLVPTASLYVTANFKETQVARMRVGQPATIDVDALPGTTLHAHVESFAPGSGSEFSLLPYEPGTGNFTKIVQRVPVRLRFDNPRDAGSRLRPGLSAEVRVYFDEK